MRNKNSERKEITDTLGSPWVGNHGRDRKTTNRPVRRKKHAEIKRSTTLSTQQRRVPTSASLTNPTEGKESGAQFFLKKKKETGERNSKKTRLVQVSQKGKLCFVKRKEAYS